MSYVGLSAFSLFRVLSALPLPIGLPCVHLPLFLFLQAPPDFKIVLPDGVPVSKRQETTIPVKSMFPCLQIATLFRPAAPRVVGASSTFVLKYVYLGGRSST